MPTTIRVLNSRTNKFLLEVSKPETHVRDVVAALRTVADNPPVSVTLYRQPDEAVLDAMRPEDREKLQDEFGTPPNIPFKTWQGKTSSELADRLEAQCDNLSTPEGITATLEGLAMELAMFGNLVAMYLVTVRHSEEGGQHMLKTTNSLRIMDRRLVENPAAVEHLRASITNSVEFVRDALDRQLGKPSGNTLVGPSGELLS